MLYIIQKFTLIIGHYVFYCLDEGREVSYATLSLELSMLSVIHILLYVSHVYKISSIILWFLLPGEYVILLNSIMTGLIQIQYILLNISTCSDNWWFKMPISCWLPGSQLTPWQSMIFDETLLINDWEEFHTFYSKEWNILGVISDRQFYC